VRTIVFKILPLVLLSGCVAIGPITTSTSTEKISAPSSHARMCPVPSEIGELTECKAEKAGSLTTEQLIAMWGEPKLHEIKEGQESLTYNRSIAWRGLFGIVIIIPIPLLLPVGHNETTFFFENNKLIHITSEQYKSSLAVCGYHSSGPNGFGCKTE